MFLFLLLLGVSCLSKVSAQCPVNATYDPNINRCYMFSAQTAKYVEAQEICSIWGGNLTSISNAFQDFFITDQATTIFAKDNASDYWIGANMLRSAEWSWMDGSPFYYSHWSAGQPDTENGNALCGVTMMNTGTWKASTCFTPKPFVCSMEYVPRAPTTTPPTPAPGHCEGKGHYLKLTDSCYTVAYGSNFENAKNTCRDLGGDLASIHSQQEDDFIAGIAHTGGSTDFSQGVWIGMYQDYGNGPWKWTDGTKMDYKNWLPGSPDDNSGKEHCVELMPDFSPDSGIGKWNDNQCKAVLRGFICQSKALH